MLINRDHRSWLSFTLVASASVVGCYLLYAAASPSGPSGGSWPGLTFGIAGTTLMAFEGLLAARRKLRTVRVGSAQLWMRAHIWLGLLAVVLILCHAGFALGGPLTTALMALFFLVVVSGVYGLVLQQFLPRLMTERVPLETIHSQITNVHRELDAEARATIESVAGIIPREEERQTGPSTDEQKWKAIERPAPAASPAAVAEPLRVLYEKEVRPYLLRSEKARRPPPDFQPFSLQIAPELQPIIDKLRALCEESRQLEVQRHLHAWLHNWLFVHAPLSFALFVLVAVHMYFALRY